MKSRTELEAAGEALLDETRTELFVSMPFLGPAMGVLTHRMDLTTRLIGTDGETVRYSPAGLIQVYRRHPYVLTRFYLHLLLHCLFRHVFSAEEYADGEVWDLSADIAAEHVIDGMDNPAVNRTASDFRASCYRKLEEEVRVLTAERLCSYFLRHPLSYEELTRMRKEFAADDHVFWRMPKRERERRTGSGQEALNRLSDEWRRTAKRVSASLRGEGRKAGKGTGSLDVMLRADSAGRTDFRALLRKFAVVREEMRVDPDSFDYRAYLLEKGYHDEDLLASNGNARWDIPLYRPFFDMQMESVEWCVSELAKHAKAYAKRTRGEDFPVTANLYQCYPLGDSVKKHLDILAGEKTNLQMRQDGWYRFASGWLNGKECCFTEDPNAYIREIVTDIKDGINDRFLLFALEPIAHGFHIAFPYGSWLQNQVKDAFWPDLRVLKKLGPWLDEHDALLGKQHDARIAVLYDSASAYENSVSEPHFNGEPPKRPDLTGVQDLGRQGGFTGQGNFAHFFDFVQLLSDRHVLYNVLFESADEPLSLDRLEGYDTVVVPDAFLMVPEFAAVLNTFAEKGGTVLTLARKVSALRAETAYAALDAPALASRLAALPALLDAPEGKDFGIDLRETAEGKALHLVNYNYNEKARRIDALNPLVFRLHFPASQVTAHAFPENPALRASLDGDLLTVENAGIYTILEIK